jgi:FixJ family two-component response regulator
VDQIPLISVVDDDEGMRRSLDALVRSLGYHVATFRSAEEFLSSAERQKSSCVISDIQMPGMSGIELMAEIGASPAAVPVILISAFPNEKMQLEANAAGAYRFLKKPFDGERLIEYLDQALTH